MVHRTAWSGRACPGVVSSWSVDAAPSPIGGPKTEGHGDLSASVRLDEVAHCGGNLGERVGAIDRLGEVTGFDQVAQFVECSRAPVLDEEFERLADEWRDDDRLEDVPLGPRIRPRVPLGRARVSAWG